MAEQVRRRVLVVGGGVAGVAAASRLARAGAPVVLLERSRRLGGRAASGTLPGFGEVDLGFHVLMRTCRSARALLRLLGAEGDVRFQPRLEVPIWRAGRVHWVKSHPLLHLTPFFFRFGHLPARERLALLRLLRGLAHVPETSAADWLRALRIPPRTVEILLRPLLLSALNGEPEEVSARYAAMVIRRVLLSPRGGALGFFQVPMSRIWERVEPLVERAGGEVRTETRVEAIALEGGRAVGVRLEGGEEIPGEAVIAALPPQELVRLLPEEHRGFLLSAEGIPWSPIVCVHFLFDRSVLPLQFLFAPGLPLQAAFSVTRLQGREGPEHVAAVLSGARDWLGKPPEEVKEVLLDSLRELAPRARAARPMASYVLRFPHATFLPAPGVDEKRPRSLNPIRGLFLAGDFVHTGWPATLEGATLSALSAAHFTMEASKAEVKSTPALH